ncbi:hypothetical protein QAD02_023111 [Eretmocerus hayati]|uniref:Uncharacterized protein n=1 Tax=Eretmocerus hayati TaxID=131215 RepID=A0ACC2PV92_9HYME|nr:hypothetical protein QAD02_023111 [Eretmocerus hayati]
MEYVGCMSHRNTLDDHTDSLEMEDPLYQGNYSYGEAESSKDSTLMDNSYTGNGSSMAFGSPTSGDILQNSSWELGKLAWARMSIYPFWPCVVTYDPQMMMTYQKVQFKGRSKTLMIHVHFFHDNGKHCWVPAHHMFPFTGIHDFRRRASLVDDAMKKKDPKLAAALVVKPNLFGNWQKAVAEAMDVLYELDLTSLENFKPRLKDLTNDTPKTNSAKRKRKPKTENHGAPKKMRLADLAARRQNSEMENNLALETPPISPSNDEDLRAATFQKQKRITKMINKLQPPDFEVYLERNFYTIKEQHPDATDEQVREYLYDVWEQMAPEEKVKYRATYKIEHS